MVGAEMDCPACGAPVAPDFIACPSCGSALDATPAAQGPVAEQDPTDPPTETMPAVPLSLEQGELAAEQVSLAPPLDPAPAPVVLEERRRGALEGRNPLLVGGLLGVLGALVLIAVVVALGGPGGPGDAGLAGNSGDPAGPAQGGTASSSATPAVTPEAAPADGSYRCEAQQLSAPGEGGWTLYRASFGSRRDFDYLTFHLRPDRSGSGTATLRAEVLPAGEVGDRYGLDVPDGAETALVVTMDGQVRISGPFGGRPGNRTLREFQVARAADGNVHAVLALNGSGCFAMSGDWQQGSGNSPTEVRLQIESP